MEVSVVLYATLTRYHPGDKGNNPFTVEMPEGATVKDLLKEIGIKESETKQVFINHKTRPDDFVLEDGQKVAIFPPVGGG
ncbi:MAG: MoaD/ThiS family protein [Bacillota bacterium]